MNRVLILAGLALLVPAGLALSQVVPTVGLPTPIACAFNSTPTTLQSGQAGWVQCDSSGKVQVSAATAPPTAIANGASTAVASNRVMKASSGSLLTLTVSTTTVSGWLMLFNATTLPVNGVVTPAYCIPVKSDGTSGGAALQWSTPLSFTTGIVAGFSSTGCFTLTASATAAFFGQVL